MKLPAIATPGVGRYHASNLPRPNAAAVGDALGDVAAAANKFMEVDTDISTATGEAAQELSELRAKLVSTNSLPADEVPDGIEFNATKMITDEKGEEIEIDMPIVFTHEVAEQWWETQSSAIINKYAGNIKSKAARDKFTDEMLERYGAPGTLAVNKSSNIKRRTHNWAIAQRSVSDVLSSIGPTEQREGQAKEILSRQLMHGADPTQVQIAIAAIGPKIDQFDTQNMILAAQSADEVDLIEEGMWSGASRMTPEQMRTMSSQMDSKRRDFIAERNERQTATADKMFGAYVEGNLTDEQVSAAVTRDDITREAGWTFLNGLNKGTTTKASDPWTLSRFRGEISRLQFVGGPDNMRMMDKAKLLKLAITRGSMGLNPNGTPTGQPASISGTDVFTLNKDIDTAIKAATENEEYKNALDSLLVWTRSKLDLEGQIVTGFGGDQNQVEAAVAFKKALDNYMNTYGIDAKPVDFFESNKGAYDPRNFSSGINGRFLSQVPQAEPYISQVKAKEYEFDGAGQQNFLLWLSDNRGTLGPERYEAVSALFNQYYRGQGIAPDNGALMLEPDDPLYRQFQQMIPDNE